LLSNQAGTHPMTGRFEERAPSRRGWQGYALAGTIFFLALAFYRYTLLPSLSWGDGTRLQREAISGESYILTEMVEVEFAYDPYPFARVGVAAWDHPLYIILGHTLVRAFPWIDSLWLVNMISAVFGAASLGVFFLILYDQLNSILIPMLTTLYLAISHTFWWHAVTPEVYSLFIFLLLSFLYLIDRYQRSFQSIFLFGSFLSLGLAASNHLLAILALPALFLSLGLAWRDRYKLQSSSLKIQGLNPVSQLPFKVIVTASLGFLAGFSLYLVQLARMLRTFPLADVMGPATGLTFLRGLLDFSPLGLAESVLYYAMFLLLQFGPIGVAFGALGFSRGKSIRAALWRKAIAFFIVYALFGIFYRVADQFAFFLTSYVFWGFAIALGLERVMETLPGKRKAVLLSAITGFALLMPCLYQSISGLALRVGFEDGSLGIPQVGIGAGIRDGLDFYANPNRRGDYTADKFGRETLKNLPKDSVVIAEWYTDTDEYYVLRYFQAIEAMRPDVEVAGWPSTDPFDFNPRFVHEKIAAALPTRPVYLASLNEEFYAASTLTNDYCIVIENNLYRIDLRNQSDGRNPDECISQQ